MTNRARDLWVVRTDMEPPTDVSEAIVELAPDRDILLESPDDWYAFTDDVDELRPAIVVAAGGDGTVQGVVRALGPGSDTTVGILPSGTGNDFARALGIPLQPREAARTVLKGESRRADLLALSVDGADEVVVVNAVTLGLSGSVHAELDEETKDRWGRFAYLRAALSAAGELEPFTADVTVRASAEDDPTKFWGGPLLHISLANGPTAGGGVPIAPDADPADGLLDICGVAEGSAWEIGKGVPAMLGEGTPDEPWLLGSVAWARVELDATRPISVDGEPREARTLEVRVLPGALTVYRPQDPEGEGAQGPP